MNIVHIILALLVAGIVGHLHGIVIEGKRIRRLNERYNSKIDLPETYEEFKTYITTKCLNIGNILDICFNYGKNNNND